jgi:hypothetical protein
MSSDSESELESARTMVVNLELLELADDQCQCWLLLDPGRSRVAKFDKPAVKIMFQVAVT